MGSSWADPEVESAWGFMSSSERKGNCFCGRTSGSTEGILLCYPGFCLFAVCLVQFPDHPCEQAYSFPFILETQRCQVSRRSSLNLSHVYIPVLALDGIWDGFLNSREREYLNDRAIFKSCLGTAHYSKMPHGCLGNLCYDVILMLQEETLNILPKTGSGARSETWSRSEFRGSCSGTIWIEKGFRGDSWGNITASSP